MPHSPRWYRDKLWLLNSGTGEFGHIENLGDSCTGPLAFKPIVFCPGYLRGLAFHENYAVVGLSLPRELTFRGLKLDEQLTQRKAKPRCGLMVIDLDQGNVAHWLRLEGEISELYDVQILPRIRCPSAISLNTEILMADHFNGDFICWKARKC